MLPPDPSKGSRLGILLFAGTGVLLDTLLLSSSSLFFRLRSEANSISDRDTQPEKDDHVVQHICGCLRSLVGVDICGVTETGVSPTPEFVLSCMVVMSGCYEWSFLGAVVKF